MEPPAEWLVSVVCESFGCLPSQAVREIQEGPAEMIWRILDLRAFARSKAEVDRTANDPKATIEEGPMRWLVLEIEEAAQQQRRTERRGTK